MFTGVAIGTILVVGVAVVGSLTALPALLSWLGRGPTGAGSVPGPAAHRGPAVPAVGGPGPPGGGPPACVGHGRPLAMLALAAPALGLRLGNPPDGGFSAGSRWSPPGRIERAFPAARRPREVVVTGQHLGPPDDGGAGRAAGPGLGPRPIRGPVSAAPVAHGRALLVIVPLAGPGTDAVSDRSLLALRDGSCRGRSARCGAPATR